MRLHAPENLSSILKDTPASITEVNPSLPPLLARIIRRCLAKDPERRYQTAKDIRNELEELKQDVDSGDAVVGVVAPQLTARPWSRTVLVAVAVVGLVAIVSMIRNVLTTETAPPRLVNPTQVTSALGVEELSDAIARW